jgi:hypothetical protein
MPLPIKRRSLDTPKSQKSVNTRGGSGESIIHCAHTDGIDRSFTAPAQQRHHTGHRTIFDRARHHIMHTREPLF